jgi:hypothetical protein
MALAWDPVSAHGSTSGFLERFVFASGLHLNVGARNSSLRL